LSSQSLLENTQVRFFADAGFKAGRDTTDRLAPEFQSSGIEILITSQLTDKISLLAEPVLKLNGSISLERVMIKYSFGNYLNVSAGRLYTPLGLWNTTFFRFAKALTPTIDAPKIIANFEEGGFAINKDNGIMISGDDIAKIRFGYRVMIGNGYNEPNSRHKIYFGNVFIEPLDNLRLSVSATTSKNKGIFSPVESTIDALIFACMYMGGKDIEFAYEFYRGRVHDAATNSVGLIHYGYVGYKIGKVTPYGQYYNGVAAESSGLVDNSHATLGVRFNSTPLSVFKTEVELRQSDDFSKVNQFRILWAIGF